MNRRIAAGSEYSRCHHWIAYHFGSANKCENEECLGKSMRYNWALKRDKKYEKIRENYLMLCASCHIAYDASPNKSEKCRAIILAKRKTHCIHGHEYTMHNTMYQRSGSKKDAWIRCRKCAYICMEKIKQRKKLLPLKN